MSPTPSVENIVAQIAVQERKAGSSSVQIAAVNEALVQSGFEPKKVKDALREAKREGAVETASRGTVRIAG